MHTTASVNAAYKKSKAQLLTELRTRGWGFEGNPSKDELVTCWLQEFGKERECMLCGKPMAQEIGTVHHECEMYEKWVADQALTAPSGILTESVR